MRRKAGWRQPEALPADGRILHRRGTLGKKQSRERQTEERCNCAHRFEYGRIHCAGSANYVYRAAATIFSASARIGIGPVFAAPFVLGMRVGAS